MEGEYLWQECPGRPKSSEGPLHEALKVKTALQWRAKNLGDKRALRQVQMILMYMDWNQARRELYFAGSKVGGIESSKHCRVHIPGIRHGAAGFGVLILVFSISSLCPHSSLLEWECLFQAIVYWKYTICFLILQRITVKRVSWVFWIVLKLLKTTVFLKLD